MKEENAEMIGIKILAPRLSLPEDMLTDCIISLRIPYSEENGMAQVCQENFLDRLTEKFWHRNDPYWPSDKQWYKLVGEDRGLKKLVSFQTLSECTMVPEDMLRSFVNDPGMPHFNINGYFLVDPLEAWEWLDDVFNISVFGRKKIDVKPLLIGTRSEVE
jgi:hypothetical protein